MHLIPVAGVDDVDVEGIWTGSVDGHYIFKAAKIVQGTDRSISLDNVIEIPKTRVWWLERLVAMS